MVFEIRRKFWKTCPYDMKVFRNRRKRVSRDCLHRTPELRNVNLLNIQTFPEVKYNE